MLTELWRLSATQLAERVRARAVSAREAARAALDRLDQVNPRVNAVVDHRPEEVLAQAAAVDQAIARGEDAGPLAGVPVTVKTNVDQAGYATSNGVTLQRDLIAAASSPVVDNLRRAGAVILGRTNTPAFSLRWFTDNRLHGATRYCGVPQLRAACQRAETLLKQDDAKAMPALDELDMAIARLASEARVSA